MSLVTPSGGLVYHLRAWRHAGSLWAPFRAALSSWLAANLPLGRELVLVGPSGGHCLPVERLRGLPHVLALEPDPLARLLLRRRLAPGHFEAESRDLLVQPLLQGRPGLEMVLEPRPDATVLFCNVLGQVHFALSDAQHEQFQSAFRERVLPLLKGRAWASFHDRWSLDHAAGRAALPQARSFARLPSDAELGQAWFGPGSEPVTALDHGTSSLFPEQLPRSYFGWQLTPTALHIVEALSSSQS